MLVNTRLPSGRSTKVSRLDAPKQFIPLDIVRQIPKADLSIELDLSPNNRLIVTVSDGNGQVKTDDCMASPSDFAEAYESILKILDKINPYIISDYLENVYKLHELGSFVFHNLFPNGPVRQIVLDVVNSSLHGSEKNATSPPLHIFVKSQICVIPWAFIYPSISEEDSQEPNIYNFFGSFSVVSVDIDDPRSVSLYPKPEIQPELSMLTAYCDTLRYSSKMEIPYLHAMINSSGVASLIEFPILQSANGGANREFNTLAIETLTNKKFAVAHFAGHGFNDKNPTKVKLQIRNQYPLYINMFSPRVRFVLRPLVFLNSCKVGYIDQQQWSSMVRTFFGMGARTVIAPDRIVPDPRAALFAIKFYECFASGCTSLESLFYARISVLKKRNSFVGFSYILFGQHNCKLTSSCKSFKGTYT